MIVAVERTPRKDHYSSVLTEHSVWSHWKRSKINVSAVEKPND